MKRLGTISRAAWPQQRHSPWSRPRAAATATSTRRTRRPPAPPPPRRHPGRPRRRSSEAPPHVTTGDLKPVKLQLQWFTQAQFAGYFAAVDQGFYKDEGLDVQILEGGVDIVPQTVLAQGNADFAIAWVPKALQSREQGADITDIAQIFQRSGTLQVSFKDKNITDRRRTQGQEGRQLGLRQRVRAVRRHDQGRARTRPGRHARPAAVRHAGAAQAATSTPPRR